MELIPLMKNNYEIISMTEIQLLKNKCSHLKNKLVRGALVQCGLSIYMSFCGHVLTCLPSCSALISLKVV